MRTIRLYFHFINVSIRNQMQYRASFIMLSIGTFLTSGIEFFAIWALFDRFGGLKGWTLPETALLYGIANTSFSIVEGVLRGFDMFPNMVKSGDFDRLLVRPVNTIIQVAGSEFQMARIGRFIQGIIVLIWACSALSIDWTLLKILLLVSTIIGGVCMFAGIFIIYATISFWTIESLEIINIVTYGGVEATQYPLFIYKEWFQKFFTYIIPLACISYYPALVLLDKTTTQASSLWLSMTPLTGLIFLAISTRIWNFGVYHYRSTGS